MPSFKCLLNGDFFFVRSRVKTVGNDHPFIKARFFERFFDPLQVISEFSPSAQGKSGGEYVNER